ncbi:LamG-like jellyroll fold domain-containing protein [Kitasatospora cineracea]|uniref:Ricin-type beta-trefoil lectin protein n=1 Tax=Kitasatospora cineracea TaxID=88074 RepID=A0A3N4RLY0_9ACTN|nr:LamG-like jellyroll fold domain-containing protein [Kitasatospora cineracea]RPE27970.1 ricin-type beta-trefoil lectin protein [Kitasatospora cineracea]
MALLAAASAALVGFAGPALADDRPFAVPPGNTTPPTTGQQGSAPDGPVQVARAKAQQSGKAVPVEDLTTETSLTVANPDGTLTRTDNLQPARVKKNGAWTALDASLDRNGDGTWSPKAVPSGVSLSGGGTGPLATFTDAQGRSLSLTLPFPLPAPVVSGTDASYRSVLPGVDLEVTVTEEGAFHEVLVVQDAKAAANPALRTLKLATAAMGLTTRANTDGSVNATAADGTPVFASPTPVMWDSAKAGAAVGTLQSKAAGSPLPGITVDAADAEDSSVKGPGHQAHVSAIKVDADAGSLTLTPDAAQLDSPDTVWPVYIDPYVSPAPGVTNHYVQVKEGCPSEKTFDIAQENGEGVGYQQYSSRCFGLYRSFYEFDISNLNARMVVSKSTMSLYSTHGADADCSATWPATLQLTGSITKDTVWPGPSASATIATTQVESANTNVGCGKKLAEFDVTSTVKAHQTNGNLTFGLVGNESKTSSNYGFMRFATNPVLTTVFDIPPNAPGPPGTTPASQNPASAACGSGSPGWIGLTTMNGNSSNITLDVPLSTDMAGVNLQAQYHVWDNMVNNGSGSPADASWPVSAGWVASGTTVHTPIGGPVSDGHQYGWNVWAQDGTLSGPSSPYCYFNVDLSAPTQAAVTPSTAFPPLGSGSTSSKHAGDSAEVTVSAGDPTPTGCSLSACISSGVREFQYSLDANIPAVGATTATATVVNGVATAKVPITVPTNQWGTHTLYVRAVDNAGNTQPTATTYSFYAPWNPAAKVTAGDLTGDGVPDLLATSTDGNLTLIGGNTDPSTTPVTASTPAQSPDHTGWNNYLIAHRGSIVQQDKDDLFAYQKQTHSLYVYKNDSTATPPGSAGHFTLSTDVQGPLHRPACVTTTAGNCSGYNSADWSSVTQMVAPGTLSADAYNAAHPTQKVGPAADLITVENGKLWYYTTGANPSTYFYNAYQIGTGNWDATTVVGVGNVGAVTAATGSGSAPTSIGGTPTLWVRDNATGAISSFRLTFDAGGIPTATLAAQTRAPLVSGVLDTTGKNMCLGSNDANPVNGSPARMQICNSSDTQSFTLGRDNTIHTLGKCLDVNQSATNNGAPVQFWDCNNSVAQKWVPGTTPGSLLNPNSGLCLADPAASNSTGTQVILWTCLADHAEQNWAATSTGSALPTTQPILPLGIGSKSYPTLSTPGDVDGDGNPEIYALAPDNSILRVSGASPLTGQLVDRWQLAGTADTARTNNLTLNGGATIGTDPVRGQALSLNGTTAHASSATTGVDTSQSFTVSAWVNLTTVPTQNVTAVSQDGTQNSGFYLQYNSTLKGWCLNTMANDTATSTGSSFSPCSSTNVAANTWVHLTGSYDAAAKTTRLYVNGTLAASTTGLVNWSAGGKVSIGSALYHGTRTDYFPGLISDVQLRTGAMADVAQFGPQGTLGYLQPKPTDHWQLTDTTDSIRTGNNLQLAGSAGFASDTQRNKVLSLNGTNGTFAAVPGPVLDTTKSFTVSTWAKANANGGVIVGQDGTTTQGFMLWPDNGTWRFAMATSDTGGWPYDYTSNVNSTAAVQMGSWTHLTAVYDADSNQMSLYVNGVLAGTGSHQTGPAFNGNLAIGRWQNNGANANFFNGSISDVRTYNTALSPAEISLLPNATPIAPTQLS